MCAVTRGRIEGEWAAMEWMDGCWLVDDDFLEVET